MLSRCAKSSASHDSTFPQSSRKNWTGSWGIQGDFGLVGIILIRPLNILLFAGVSGVKIFKMVAYMLRYVSARMVRSLLDFLQLILIRLLNVLILMYFGTIYFQVLFQDWRLKMILSPNLHQEAIFHRTSWNLRLKFLQNFVLICYVDWMVRNCIFLVLFQYWNVFLQVNRASASKSAHWTLSCRRSRTSSWYVIWIEW